MSINLEFYAPRHTVEIDGVELCTVRGLTPDDIARLVSEHAEEVEKVMSAMEKDDNVAGVLAGGEISSAVENMSSAAFTSLISTVPSLAAKIIAIAADEPTMWSHVQKNFVIPVQFNVLTEIARLTFVDKNGFKQFLGNVMVLVGNMGTTTQHRNEIAPSQSNTPG